MRTLLCLCVCSVLLTLGDMHAQKSTISILIDDTQENYTSFYYKKRGVSSAHVNQVLDAELRSALPCATILSRSDIRQMLQYDKDRQLLSGTSSGVLDDIAGAMGADYIVGSTFGNVGDERHWMLSVTILAQRSNRATAKGVAQAEGQAADVFRQLIKKVVDQIAESNICPWKGTIRVTKSSSVDTSSTTVSATGWSTTTTTETIVDKLNETWSIEAVGKPSGKTWGKGTVNQTTHYHYRTESNESGKLSCFRSEKPCSIVDDRMPATFEHYLGLKKHSTTGNRTFDDLKIIVTFTSDSAFVSLEGDPFAVGTGKASEYEMKENDCHKCVIKDEDGEITGVTWGARIFGGPAKRPTHTISGTQQIREGKEVTEITWDLHQ